MVNRDRLLATYLLGQLLARPPQTFVDALAAMLRDERESSPDAAGTGSAGSPEATSADPPSAPLVGRPGASGEVSGSVQRCPSCGSRGKGGPRMCPDRWHVAPVAPIESIACAVVVSNAVRTRQQVAEHDASCGCEQTKALQAQVYALQDRLAKCDERDSAALSELRAVIDDEIGWEDGEQEEAGDYLARLKETAKSLRKVEKLRQQLDFDRSSHQADRDRLSDLVLVVRRAVTLRCADDAEIDKLAAALREYDEYIPF